MKTTLMLLLCATVLLWGCSSECKENIQYVYWWSKVVIKTQFIERYMECRERVWWSCFHAIINSWQVWPEDLARLNDRAWCKFHKSEWNKYYIDTDCDKL